MSPELIGILCLIALLFLIIIGVPVAFAMAITGIAGFWLIGGWQATGSIVGMLSWEKVTSYSFTVLPLFILMGNVAYVADFGRDIFEAGRKWVGHLPGGLAQATVIANAFFAAACGSATAATATFAKIAVPEMKKAGYDNGLATGSVAAAGTLSTMIPPSISMVIYGMVTEQSIGKLLIAGFLPGALEATNYMLQIGIRCRLNTRLGAPMARSTWTQRFISLKGIWAIGLISLFVMGSIYTGFTTPTEAGAIGAFGALVLGFAARRLTMRGLRSSLLDTARVTGMMLAIVVGAFIFNATFAISRLPSLAAEFVGSLPVPNIFVLIAILLLFIFLGTFMSGIAIMFLTMPILMPVINQMGWDPIWFGILFAYCREMGMITPPVGITLFAVKAVVTDVPTTAIVRGVVPFIITDFINLSLLIAFPQISLFLPSMMSR